MISASILAVNTKRYGERFRLSFPLSHFYGNLTFKSKRGSEKATFKGNERVDFVKINSLLADDAGHLKDFQFLFNFKYGKVTFSVREFKTASYKFTSFDQGSAYNKCS
jgi:hypothetical protein